MAQAKKLKEAPEDKLRLYVKEHLLPELNLKERKFSIEPTDKGCHSLITFLRINEFKPLIIRGVRKKYKLNRIVKNSNHLSQLGFNVPEICYADGSRETYRNFGHYLLFEEKIEGNSLYELADPTDFTALIAKMFADLHSINSNRWGMIGSQKESGFFRYINRKIQNELKQLKNLDSNFFTPKEIKDYSRWFKDQKNIIKNCRRFSLCHGDPYLTNILLTKDNQLYLLDNDHTKYYPMAVEFYKFGFVLNQDDHNKMSTWQSTYLSSLSEELRKEFQRCSNFYLAYVLLHIISGLLADNWRREKPYTFSPDHAKYLFRQCIEG